MDKKQMMIDYLCDGDEFIRFVLSKNDFSNLESVYNRRKDCEIAWKRIFGIISDAKVQLV